jgi:PPOX class probable F420-dependent enzyme
VDPVAAREAVANARVARLATVGGDGRPHLVPICFALVDGGPVDGTLVDAAPVDGGLVGAVLYSAVDHKPKRSARLRRLANVESTPDVCVLVDAYDEDWSRLWWVRLDGRGRIVRDADEAVVALDALRARYEQYAARPPSGPILAVDVGRWTAWSA